MFVLFLPEIKLFLIVYSVGKIRISDPKFSAISEPKSKSIRELCNIKLTNMSGEKYKENIGLSYYASILVPGHAAHMKNDYK